MHSFDPSFLKKQQFPISVLNSLHAVYEAKERMQIKRLQNPRLFQKLEKEQQKIELKKVKAPHHPPEEEKDYAKAMAFVRKHANTLPFNLATVMKLHAIALQSQKMYAGCFKDCDNVVRLSNNNKVLGYVHRIPARLCEKYMDALDKRFKKLWRSGKFEPLVLISAYLLDFAQIHPFKDGTGRTSRLLLMLLLFQAGHEVCKYVNLENIIRRHYAAYMIPFLIGHEEWKKKKHSLAAACEFVANIVLEAYQEIERKTDELF